MVRGALRGWAVLLGFGVFLVASVAFAQDKVSRLADKLANGDDFRVRTQAALALGASKSKRAVKPLCDGLEDSNTTVRAAAAAALGKLKKGGTSCLEERLEEESSSSVKSVIKRSLKKLKKAGGDEDLGKLGSGSDYYVAIDETSDKTKRGGDGVDRLVRRAMIEALRKKDGFVVAPKGEKASSAKKLLKSHKGVTGFLLLPKVKKPRYKNGALTMRVQVTVFTYPGKALKGMIPVKFTQEGTSSKDEKAEDELIEMGVKSAVKKFLKNIGRFE